MVEGFIVDDYDTWCSSMESMSMDKMEQADNRRLVTRCLLHFTLRRKYLENGTYKGRNNVLFLRQAFLGHTVSGFVRSFPPASSSSVFPSWERCRY